MYSLDLLGPTGVIENGSKALFYSPEYITAVVERGPPGARLPVAERSNYTIVVLVKNGRLLIVQTEDIPSSDEWRTMSYDDVMADCRAYEALLSQRLSVVASLLDTIEFEKSQFAILVSDAQQSRLVAQPLDDIPPLIAPLGWLPRVQESDLHVIQWLDDRVHCIWNDQQVDFFTTFAIPNRWRLQQMITITHLLEKSKIHITYEPLAIVLRGAEVSGLIMARVEGRLLEMRDRSLESVQYLYPASRIKYHVRDRTFYGLTNLGTERETDSKPGLGERWTSSSMISLKCWRKPTLLNYVPNPEPLIFRIIYWTNTSAEKYQNAERKKKDRHSTKPHLKSDTNSFMRHKTANSLWKPAYHPYGTDKYTLLISSQPEIARRTSDKHNRRRASRVVVRAVSMASDYTLVDVDDDTTVIGD
ncbi:hypothetical protein F5051DRAFT_425816 [Lentinula edodes]|nr:hypothetical protein F5051DRAFT_425816 [Lentinula edodes]